MLDSFLPPSYASTRWRLFQHGILVRPEEDGEDEDEDEEDELSPPTELVGGEGCTEGSVEAGVKSVARTKGGRKGGFFKHRSRKSRKAEPQKAEAMTPDESLREQAAKCVQIMSTRTVCDVRWGDGTIERGIPGIALHALEHLGNHDFFPEDFVVEEEDADERWISCRNRMQPSRRRLG